MSCSSIEAAELQPASLELPAGCEHFTASVQSALVKAAGRLCTPDALVILGGDTPPTASADLLKFFGESSSVGYGLIVPTSGSAWVELGFPAGRICEHTPSRPELAHGELTLGKLSENVELSVRTGPDDFHTVILDLGGADVMNRVWDKLGHLVSGPNGALIRIGHTHVEDIPVDEAGCFVRVELDTTVALPLLAGCFAGVEWASFIVLDSFFSREEPYTEPTSRGAEVIAPINTRMSWIVRKACSEFGAGLAFAIAGWQAIVSAIYNPVVMEAVPPKSSVPRQYFSVTRDGDLLVARIVVLGARFPGKNLQLQAREAHVRAILAEMLEAFGSEDYQSRLARVRDQLEVRDMVKAVHVNILPKHGFPIAATTKFGDAMQTQSRMQIFLFTGINGTEENLMGESTLALSGIFALHKLPLKYKPNPVDSTTLSADRIATTSAVFKQYEPTSPVVYGGWLGWRRALTTFLHAGADEMAEYLRSDPAGPFAGRLDDWPLGANQDLQSRWHRWCFQMDTKEAVLKTDWHALPRLGRGQTDLFVPRLARTSLVCCAPPRLLAFLEAFRAVNSSCWAGLAQALRELRKERASDRSWREADSGELAEGLADCLAARHLFGAVEVQVWWGDGCLVLPSHKDGATSLLHLSLTLGGCRVLRMGVFRSMLGHMPRLRGDAAATAKTPGGAECREDVWDESAWCGAWKDSGTLEDVRMVRGSVYLSSPYCFEHGVRYDMGSQQEPVIALQCRFAFDPKLAKKLNSRRDDTMWDISNVIAKSLQASAESGELRMPRLEEVKQHLANLPAAPSTSTTAAETPGLVSVPAPVPAGDSLTSSALRSSPLQRGASELPVQAPQRDSLVLSASRPSPAQRGASELPVMAPPSPLPPPQACERERDVQQCETESDRAVRGRDMAKKDRLAWEAAKERGKLRDRLLSGRGKARSHLNAADRPISDVEKVEVAIRHGQQDGQVVVTVPCSATMLEVKEALVQKIGRGLVRKVQLVKETGHTFAPYRDQEQLGDRRELVMLGLHLGVGVERCSLKCL